MTLTNVDYQTSFLGSFYYAATGTNLARLLNAGCRTASSAGLTNCTKTTNQVADNGTVDIGYHFFGVNPNTTVTIEATTPVATEGGGNGQFTVFRTGPTSSALTIYYKVDGTAIPGTDYNALSNFVSIPVGQPSQGVQVVPIDNNAITFDKTVIASLILTNTYFVGSPSQATVTVQDTDTLSTNPVSVAAISPIPTGIDYHPVNSSLIISRNDTSGNEKNFKRLATNGVLSDWSTARGLGFTKPDGFACRWKKGTPE